MSFTYNNDFPKEFYLDKFKFFIEEFKIKYVINYDFKYYGTTPLVYETRKPYITMDIKCYVLRDDFERFLNRYVIHSEIPLLFRFQKKQDFLPQALFVYLINRTMHVGNILINNQVFNKIYLRLEESPFQDETKKCPFCQKYGMMEDDQEINGFLINKCVLCDAIWYDDITLDTKKKSKKEKN